MAQDGGLPGGDRQTKKSMLRGCLKKARAAEAGVIQAVDVERIDTRPYGGH